MQVKEWGKKLFEKREILVLISLTLLYMSSINVNWTTNWLDPTDRPALLAPLTALLLPIVFFLNVFYFIPRFLSAKKWYYYFLITIPLLLLIEVTRAILVYFFVPSLVIIKEIFLHQESFIIGRPNILFTALFFSFAYRFSMDWIRNRKTIDRLQAEKSQMELHLLKSQIDPHFLFNNLNALDDLIDRDKEEAKIYLNRLSKLYRYSLLNMEKDVVKLTHEWEFVEDYVYLLQQRFGGIYQFKMEANIELENYLIPPSALQCLVENSVKHNQGSVKEPLMIEIIAGETGISVSHEKRLKLKDVNSLGTGLQNLKNRYQLLSNKAIEIIDEDHFTVTLPLIKEA